MPFIKSTISKNIDKILIFKKTSKLQYLIDKYGKEVVKNSPEYDKLNDSMIIQEENSSKFINELIKKSKANQHIKIVTDSFLNNENIYNQINKETFDQVFSLGGDGTFLRSTTLVNKGNPLFIGVNTDLKRSTGFYCCLNINESDLSEKLDKLRNRDYKEKEISKVKVCFPKKNEVFYFINDMYFGERFLGRVSKYEMGFNNNENKAKINCSKCSNNEIFDCISNITGYKVDNKQNKINEEFAFKEISDDVDNKSSSNQAKVSKVNYYCSDIHNNKNYSKSIMRNSGIILSTCK